MWGEGAQPHQTWHGVTGNGACPHEIPQWDWNLLVQASVAEDAVQRAQAMHDLHEQSRIPAGEIDRLAKRYAQIIRSSEYQGRVDLSNAECGGEAFAWLSGPWLNVR